MNPNQIKQAKQMANSLNQQIVVLRDRTDGQLYGCSAIAWITADGEIEGMNDYEFVRAVDPDRKY